MRVYKPTYTRPLPAGATKFTQRSGKNRGLRFAKFEDRKGHTKTERLTKNCKKILVETKLWHIEFDDSLGIHRELKAYTDHQATQRLADKIQDLLNCKANNVPLTDELQKWLEQIPSAIRDELIKFGILEPRQAERGKPLSDHIVEYTNSLTKKERDLRYVHEVGYTLNVIFEKCGFITWQDISAAKLRDYLDDLRDAGKGIGKRRYNSLLGAIKSFCRWMVRQQKATNSPIEFLEGMDNQQTDPRHPRRALELNDFRRFLEAAVAGPKLYGLTGYERNLLYRFAAETGLRSVDIRRLRVSDFDYSERKITIKAGRTKNKSDATVYLKPATAAELQQYCRNKLPNAPFFYFTDKTSPMVRFDLANTVVKDANGNEVLPAIPYVENGEYFDFHALRHQCASLLAMNPNTSETVRQKAMRHKTPAMTRHYSHAFEDQQREAVESMPDLTQPSTESQAAARTGTDDKSVNRKILPKSCFQGRENATNVERCTQINFDTEEKTPLQAKNEGINQIYNLFGDF